MKKDGVWRRPLAWLEPRAPKVHNFLISSQRPTPAIRETLGGILVILLLITILWGATGQPLNRSPVVVIESGSMMRCDQGLHMQIASAECDGPYGRLGTIDPGDLIFVADVDKASDVEGAAGCIRDDGKKRFGACGDTIIYRPGGSLALTPVIHRTMLYLELEQGRFSVPECGIKSASRELVMANDCIRAVFKPGTQTASTFSELLGKYESQHPYNTWGSEHSGFITLGDNNNGVDQGTNIAPIEPIQPEWILGKARGELPWLGLLKLWVTDGATGTDNYANAPSDTKTLMWISVVAIVAGPVLYEAVLKRRWRGKEEEEKEFE